jgi:HK97 gp10 family phage protein
MPEVIRAKVEGAAELKQTLNALGVEVATKVGVAANRKAAKTFQEILRGTAPYDPRPKRRPYGHLRENIRVSRRKAANQGHIVFWITVGHAFWGLFLELGTRLMSARPWMLPAFQAARDLIGKTQIDALRDGIEKAAKRLAKIRRRG